MDDTIAFSQTWEDYLADLKAVFLKVREYGLTSNPNKCHIGVIHTNYFGYIIGWGQLQA